jgi:hypothetical protein
MSPAAAAIIAAVRKHAADMRDQAVGADDRGAVVLEAEAVRWIKLADDLEAELAGTTGQGQAS